MYKKTIKIVNPTGLHARPASDFVATAKKFTSKIKIKDLTADEEPANAKSILTVLALGLAKGTEAEITAEGEDEEQAVESLAALIESGFDE
ncbi:HPr family phosphocarrier protein [Extibacter muris]|uniref:HPr family phosphocarrier protein n=1 Tax=Extibacter muris TaxID=1796622 RepID=UPI001D082A5A|nr:HPr family phosphocarrier protein [Extibacter muris]MCB6203439.1 HPr family phosphocarrier protein [Extibacter muris]MCQ4665015.1 HPr family phosphocarrier protein [Extibacter muris]MCQ4694380.1 HPr family phosphocarrier protein [Extibacter muris]